MTDKIDLHVQITLSLDQYRLMCELINKYGHSSPEEYINHIVHEDLEDFESDSNHENDDSIDPFDFSRVAEDEESREGDEE